METYNDLEIFRMIETCSNLTIDHMPAEFMEGGILQVVRMYAVIALVFFRNSQANTPIVLGVWECGNEAEAVSIYIHAKQETNFEGMVVYLNKAADNASAEWMAATYIR